MSSPSDLESHVETAAGDNKSQADPAAEAAEHPALERNSSELPVSGDAQLDETPLEESSGPSDNVYGPVGGNSFMKQPEVLPELGQGKVEEAKVELSAEAVSVQAAQEPTRSALSMFSFGFGSRREPEKIPLVEVDAHSNAAASNSLAETLVPAQTAFGSFGMRLLDMRNNAVKAVQTKARHLVSQNKRRYQEGGFDLDMTYITDSIIAMGFPGGDLSSGMLGYIEGFYRNHMEDVINFLEMHHKDKYKVYNLCAERLYDPSLLEGKVACFPFDDHNCPPLQLLKAFCVSAKSWLAGGLDNVVVVHCKAGMGRTGLMISCLLLYLKFFPTAEEAIAYFNGKRCTDGRALVLPSQIRYVKYFEKILREFDGEAPRSRKCILRGIRLHRCPYWIRPSIVVSNHTGVLFSSKRHPRTRDLMPEDIWHNAPRKGVVVFALPGEPCVADIGSDDFKIYLQDRHGDFFFWLNPNMIGGREFLTTADLDWFDQRKLPAPGFQVEVVLMEGEARRPEPAIPSTSSATPANSPAPASLTSKAVDSAPLSLDAAGAAAKALLSQQGTAGAEAASPERPPLQAAKEDIFTDSEGEDESNGGAKLAEAVTPTAASTRPDSASEAAKTEQAAAPPATTFGVLANAMAGMGGTSGGLGKNLEASFSKSLSFMGITMPASFAGSSSPLPAGAPATTSQPPASGSSEVAQAMDTAQLADKKPPVAREGDASTEAGATAQAASASPDAPETSKSTASSSADNVGTKAGEQKGSAAPVSPTSDIKAIAAAAADSSVFSFGDEEDYLSD